MKERFEPYLQIVRDQLVSVDPTLWCPTIWCFYKVKPIGFQPSIWFCNPINSKIPNLSLWDLFKSEDFHAKVSYELSINKLTCGIRKREDKHECFPCAPWRGKVTLWKRKEGKWKGHVGSLCGVLCVPCRHFLALQS